MSERVYYGVKDRERLTAITPYEAIEQELDDLPRNEWPITIEIHEYRPMKAQLHADSLLERVLEDLDEEHGDWEGEAAGPTPKMREAAQVFADTVLAEYYVFQCESVGKAKYDVQLWAADAASR